MHIPPQKTNEIDSAVSALKTNVTEYKKTIDDKLLVKVSSNLLARHAQLYWLEELTKNHSVHEVLEKEQIKKKEHPSSTENNSHFIKYETSKCSSDEKSTSEKLLPEERAYHLAVTDLFVEKAQAFLEERADSYQRSGKTARRVACAIVLIGAILAWQQMVSHHGDYAKSWLEMTTLFTRAFTAYGMVVLAAVGFWKYSKAMLDQSERLYERRHALRQGRLFVHLNDGKLTIDQMEKAFKWNESQENAFANINAESSAPWGAVAKELAKSFPDIFKAGIQAVGKSKSDEK